MPLLRISVIISPIFWKLNMSAMPPPASLPSFFFPPKPICSPRSLRFASRSTIAWSRSDSYRSSDCDTASGVLASFSSPTIFTRSTDSPASIPPGSDLLRRLVRSTTGHLFTCSELSIAFRSDMNDFSRSVVFVWNFSRISGMSFCQTDGSWLSWKS